MAKASTPVWDSHRPLDCQWVRVQEEQFWTPGLIGYLARTEQMTAVLLAQHVDGADQLPAVAGGHGGYGDWPEQ